MCTFVAHVHMANETLGEAQDIYEKRGEAETPFTLEMWNQIDRNLPYLVLDGERTTLLVITKAV